MHGTVTERSYVDLPIVGSGGSSVGGELVDWLRGVWPHNHSHNDSLLSVSLSLSSVCSRNLTLFVRSASPLVSSSRVSLVRRRSVSSRFCQPNSWSTVLITIVNSFFLFLSISRSYHPNAQRSPFCPKPVRTRQ